MKVFKCDWCEKVYEKNDSETQGMTRGEEPFTGLVFLRTKRDGERFPVADSCTDLCDECLRAIYRLHTERYVQRERS